MEFDILGPIAVRMDGHVVRLGPANRRALLALLILEANRPVSTERILGALRGHAGPRSSAPALHSHIAQLRKILGTGRLRTTAGGYQLTIEEGELDAALFQAELRRAQVAMEGGDPARAAVELERGLARWRGPALMDAVAAEWAAIEGHRLDELRVVAEETLLDAMLALGQHEQVVELAEAAISDDPQRESVWAGLMLALYRSGRSADAVRAYQQLRSALQADSGRSPSVELANLERAILLRDPSLRDAQPPKVLTARPPTTTSGSDRGLPGGVVTFLMTDVVGSTRLWETAPAAMRVALARHDELMKIAVESHDGMLLRERGEGDSTFSVFRRATDAAAAALAAQLSLSHEPWPSGCVIQVRMAMHTGEASERDGDYYGRPVNRVARLRAIAEGGQILVGQSAAEILLDHLPSEAGLIALGVKELRDFDRPETVYLLGGSVVGVQQLVDEAKTSEIPTVAGEAPISILPPADAVSTASASSWEVIVDADRTYYAHSADEERPFPDHAEQRVIPLTEDAIFIGRYSSSSGDKPEIALSGQFEDPGVSRAHAVLERQQDGSYALVDPGSTNGTFLNNMEQPIPHGTSVSLGSGDCIYLGAWTRIRIRAK